MRWLNQWYSVTVIGFSVIFLLLAVQFWIKFITPPSYPISRVLKYSFTITNPTNSFLEQAKFWTYTPMPITGTQKLKNLSTSTQYDAQLDSLGNQKITIKINNLPPFGSRTVSVKALMDISNSPHKVDEDSLDVYLSPEKNIESNDSKILSIAEGLKGDSVQDTLLNSYRWVRQTVNDVGYVKKDHGALHTLKSKQGDCTEFMYLLMAVSRANGIPVRGMAGYVNSESVILKPMDYHNWVEAYIDGRWWVVDALKGVFMENPSHYVAIRIISNASQKQNESTQQFFASDNSISVKMN